MNEPITKLRELAEEIVDYCEASDDACRGTISTVLARDWAERIRSAIAQQPRLCGDKRPCDAGEICIGCQPRECPDARPRVPDEMVLTDYRGGYGINTKHGFQRGTKFVEATRDEANGWNACRAAMLGDPE